MQPPTEPSEKKHRWYTDIRVRVALFAALIFFLAVSSVAGWFLSYALQPGPLQSEDKVVVSIPKGASIQQIVVILDKAGLINADARFILIARLTGLAGSLQAGEFSLQTNLKPVDVIRELAFAHPLEHSVTITEGLNTEEVADILAADGWVDKQRFLHLAHDRAFLDELGLRGSLSVEGYLFPDTYHLVRPPPEEKQIIRKLVERALSVWESLAGTDVASGLSRNEVFTLASIIEKETGRPEERPVIAGVFLNRLRKNMRLQSDPTVIYGMADFDGNLLRSDLKEPTPYNTYLIPGLPPGPICNPGKEALQAVLLPDKNDYLYFVSRNDGTHHFSKTLKEHNRAVREYRRSKSVQQNRVP